MANADIVKQLYLILNGANLKLVEQVLSAKTEFHNPATDTSKDPLGSFISYFGELKASFPDAVFEVQDIFEQADRVADRTVMRGTFTGAAFRGIPPTRQKLTITNITVSQVDGKQIIGRWSGAAGWP